MSHTKWAQISRLAGLGLGLLSLVTCGSKSPTEPGDFNCLKPALQATGTFAATINGTKLSTTYIGAGYDSATGEFSVSGYNCTAPTGMGVSVSIGTGLKIGVNDLAHGIGNRGGVSIGTSGPLLHYEGDGDWDSDVPNGSGTLTLLTLTASGATGTFSFVAQPDDKDTTGTKTVTNGSFAIIKYSPGHDSAVR